MSKTILFFFAAARENEAGMFLRQIYNCYGLTFGAFTTLGTLAQTICMIQLLAPDENVFVFNIQVQVVH